MIPCPRIGKIILGRYQVLDLVDIGGQASVALPVCVDTGEKVAVRMLDADATQESYDEEFARLKRAAELIIGHRGVNDPIDYDEEADGHYMVAPFVDGADLHSLVHQQGGRLPLVADWRSSEALRKDWRRFTSRGSYIATSSPQTT